MSSQYDLWLSDVGPWPSVEMDDDPSVCLSVSAGKSPSGNREMAPGISQCDTLTDDRSAELGSRCDDVHTPSKE